MPCSGLIGDFGPLQEILQRYGYNFDRLTHFKKIDRITVSKPNFKLTISLRKHLKDFTLLEILEAILTSDELKDVKSFLEGF